MVTQGVELPLTPTALLARCAGQPFVFALDGTGVGSWNCGHALLGFGPRATLRVAADGAIAVCADHLVRHEHGDPFDALDRFIQEWGPSANMATPFAGGVVAALSYDLRHWVERLPKRRRDERESPVLHAAIYDWLLAYSYSEKRYTLASWRCSPAELRRVATTLESLAAMAPPAWARACPRWTVDRPREEYLTAVRTALGYIAAGDIYQVNLAQRFVVADPPPAAALFAALQQQHPVPFAAYVDGGDFVLISNSPECFFTRYGDRLATFPIKGTRRRDVDRQADAALVRELQTDPKERAEHVMVVDLERNDLGRVCQIGSVGVEEFERIHTFPSLHHMVSKVVGEVRPGTALADILRAMFPGGSITGAPKVRAMQIIDELEPVARGFYTGAVGFVGFDAMAVFNLAIRTAVATAEKLTYHAGGGIVADSVPAREYEETLLKAQPFFAALNASVA